jgi:hypothetical protein
MVSSMPLTYVIDQKNKIVFSTASGVLTTGDVLEHRLKLKKDKDFQPGFSQLYDASTVTSIEMDPAGIRNMAAINVFDPHSRRACVATAAVAVGLFRMFQAYGDIAETYKNVRVFNNRDEAMNWLAEK